MVGSTPAVKFVFNYDTTSVLEDWANWNFVFRERLGCEFFRNNVIGFEVKCKDFLFCGHSSTG